MAYGDTYYGFVSNRYLSSQISALSAQVEALTAYQQATDAKVEALLTQGNQIMATLDDDVAAIAQQTTLVASVKTFVEGLQAQLAALPGLTADQQAKIDTIFDQVNANNAVASAIVANTPAANVPTS